MNSVIYNKLKHHNMFSLTQKLMLFFLFLGSMNGINRYYYWVYIAFAVYVLLEKPKIKLTPTFYWLGILSISLLIFSESHHDSITGMLKVFTYLFCYLMGEHLFRSTRKSNSNDKEKTIHILWTIFGSGTFVHMMLNMLTNLNNSNRNTIDFWTGMSASATLQAALGCIPICLSCAILFGSYKKMTKLMALSVIILVMLYNLVLSGRTLILLFLICIAVSVGFVILKSDNPKHKIGILIAFLIAVFIVIYLFSNNVFGITDTVMESNLYERFFGQHSDFDVGEDARMSKKINFLRDMLDFPFGGCHLRSRYGYAHDLFLDTYDDSGFLSLIAVVAIVLLAIKNFLRLMVHKTVSFNTKLLYVCVYIGIFLEFFIEPILIGCPWFFAIFCFMDGATYQFLHSYDNTIENTQCFVLKCLVDLKK